ncbi:Reverse transcriptase domain-containing protein [Aphis craccivora]|uniref:Reverse transcriptase domain-containing protein n=1 Tax=Aphis craccivora TaxID=307492 RepID=A0A6G0Y932_APHCR|nr:Reverse transcriptase domain-containing protein [Aphis craccivora]
MTMRQPLLSINHGTRQALDQGFQVGAIYTDFQKAFDKVNHNLLYFKLKNHDIDGNFLKWLFSYLSDHTQVV